MSKCWWNQSAAELEEHKCADFPRARTPLLLSHGCFLHAAVPGKRKQAVRVNRKRGKISAAVQGCIVKVLRVKQPSPSGASLCGFGVKNLLVKVTRKDSRKEGQRWEEKMTQLGVRVSRTTAPCHITMCISPTNFRHRTSPPPLGVTNQGRMKAITPGIQLALISWFIHGLLGGKKSSKHAFFYIFFFASDEDLGKSGLHLLILEQCRVFMMLLWVRPEEYISCAFTLPQALLLNARYSQQYSQEGMVKWRAVRIATAY